MLPIRGVDFLRHREACRMDLEGVEPRRTLWALGEVWWEDATGTSCRIPATIEDTSSSGACVRVKAAIEVGSNLTVKWHREQFSGVAKNRRREGSEFLVGIQRQKGDAAASTTPPSKAPASSASVSAPVPIAEVFSPLPVMAQSRLVPVPALNAGVPHPLIGSSTKDHRPASGPVGNHDKLLAETPEREVPAPTSDPVPAAMPAVLPAVFTV